MSAVAGAAKGGDAPAPKVFADMNPLEALLFASSSTENCATIRSAGIELKPVAIFHMENYTVFLHPDVSSPDELKPEEYYVCHSELAKHSDESKTAFMVTMASLLNGHLVTRVRIIFHSNVAICFTLIHVLLPLLTKGKVYDCLDLNMQWCRKDPSSYSPMFLYLTEMMPVRHLSIQSGCIQSDCTKMAVLVYDHLHPDSRSILERVSGDLRCSSDIISRFPNLRSFNNTSEVAKELASDHLVLLKGVCNRIKAWKSGGPDWFFSTTVLQSFKQLSSDNNYNTLIKTLADSTKVKAPRFANGNWETVYSMELEDGATLECVVVSLSNGERTSIKCAVHKKDEKKEEE